MTACAQCSSPLSAEAASGYAPCARCGMLNARPPNPYAVNAPSPWTAAAAGNAPQIGQAWGCPQCRKENQPHYSFCLGCGAARDSAGGAERAERAPGEARSSQGPVVLIAVGVAVVVAVAAIGVVVALVLLR